MRMSRLSLGFCLEQSFLCIGSYCLTEASDQSRFILAYHESREYLHVFQTVGEFLPNFSETLQQFLILLDLVGICYSGCKGEKESRESEGSKAQRFPRSALAVMEYCQFNLKEHSLTILITYNSLRL
jgi:hypothetical protein